VLGSVLPLPTDNVYSSLCIKRVPIDSKSSVHLRLAGVRAVGQQEKLFVGMILILIFAEALGLYGLIVALILSQNSFVCERVTTKDDGAGIVNGWHGMTKKDMCWNEWVRPSAY